MTKRTVFFSGAGVTIFPLLVCLAIFLSAVGGGGCNDDDDDELEGTAVLKGTVESFETATVSAYLLAAVSDVAVSIQGAVSRSTTTDVNGGFVFSNLPSGDYSLQFSYGGQLATYLSADGQTATVAVYDDQQTEISGIQVSGGQVTVGGVSVGAIGTATETPDNTETNGTQEETQQQENQPQTQQTEENQQESSTTPSTQTVSTVSYSGAEDVVLISTFNTIPLDVDADGVDDYVFSSPEMSTVIVAPQSASVIVGPLSSGAVIESSTAGWSHSTETLVSWVGLYSDEYSRSGPWADKTGYMGLKFSIDGATHYGWAQLVGGVRMVGWAYQTEAGVAIQAGQTE